jgi:hypothetical protein
MKLENREGKKRASLISAYLHAQNTRRCDPGTRNEVETLLKQGHGIRATARLMKGRIGKTTVAKIAKEIKCT